MAMLEHESSATRNCLLVSARCRVQRCKATEGWQLRDVSWFCIKVEPPVARRSPYRSRRAVFPHRALLKDAHCGSRLGSKFSIGIFVWLYSLWGRWSIHLFDYSRPGQLPVLPHRIKTLRAMVVKRGRTTWKRFQYAYSGYRRM